MQVVQQRRAVQERRRLSLVGVRAPDSVRVLVRTRVRVRIRAGVCGRVAATAEDSVVVVPLSSVLLVPLMRRQGHMALQAVVLREQDDQLGIVTLSESRTRVVHPKVRRQTSRL